MPVDDTNKKRSIAIAGRKTSVSVEDAFWEGLNAIAAQRSVTLGDVATEIDSTMTGTNLSSAIRLHVLRHFMAAAQGNAQSDAAQA